MATDGRDSTWYERRAEAIRILASEACCGYTRERLEQIASGWESCAMSMRLAERDELWLVSRQARKLIRTRGVCTNARRTVLNAAAVHPSHN